MASVYNPLGVASPMLLVAKQLYRTICDEKIAWDKPLPKDVERKWLHWLTLLTKAICMYQGVYPARIRKYTGLNCMDLAMQTKKDVAQQFICW